MVQNRVRTDTPSDLGTQSWEGPCWWAEDPKAQRGEMTCPKSQGALGRVEHELLKFEALFNLLSLYCDASWKKVGFLLPKEWKLCIFFFFPLWFQERPRNSSFSLEIAFLQAWPSLPYLSSLAPRNLDESIYLGERPMLGAFQCS